MCAGTFGRGPIVSMRRPAGAWEVLQGQLHEAPCRCSDHTSRRPRAAHRIVAAACKALQVGDGGMRGRAGLQTRPARSRCPRPPARSHDGGPGAHPSRPPRQVRAPALHGRLIGWCHCRGASQPSNCPARHGAAPPWHASMQQRPRPAPSCQRRRRRQRRRRKRTPTSSARLLDARATLFTAHTC